MISRRIIRSRPRLAVPARPRRKWLWVRESYNNVGPVHQPNTNYIDMLGTFKTQMGINLNLPDITIWRVIIKISVHLGLAPAAYTDNSGITVATFVDDEKKSDTANWNMVTSPFDEQYMMWDNIYVAQSQQYYEIPTALGGYALYERYDMRTHRKLRNVNETLFTAVSETGNANLIGFSAFWSVLIKLP